MNATTERLEIIIIVFLSCKAMPGDLCTAPALPGDLCTDPMIISLSPSSLATDVNDVILGASGL